MIAPPRLPALESRPGWEMRWQLTLIEPAEPADPDFDPKPRINLVISVTPSTAATPLDAARDFLQATAAAVPGLQHAEPEPIAFADATPGARIDLNFPASADVRLRQLHLFRLDGTTLAQLVITGEADEPPDTLAELERTALDYAPSPAGGRGPG